jgi:hydrogenase maturation protease
MGSALVIGYGNELCGDDGAGYLLAQRLADDPRLAGTRVLATRQLTPELALDVSRAAALVLIDANASLPAGEVAVKPLERANDQSTAWSHHMTPETLLGLAVELYGTAPPAFVVSIGAGSLEVNEGLSRPVEAALPRAADEVACIVSEAVRA